MNVLMVTNEFPPSIGGVQTHVHELSKALVRLGHQVFVVTRLRDSSLPELENLDGIDVYRFKFPDNHLIYDWQLRRRLHDLIKDHSINIVHIHGMRPLAAAKKISVPVVFTNHTSSFLKRSQQGDKVRRKMLNQLEAASLILAVSQILVEQTKACDYQGPVKFISNGVDTHRFSPGSSGLRQKLKIPEQAFVVVMAGRLHAVKGVTYLAKAISTIEHSDLHLVVAGDGSERGEFEAIIRSSPCADRVHMLGAVANAEMPEIYRAADAAILPSLMEATSIAGLEAMSCGLPVIATRVGGLPVIISNGVNGLLVEPESSEALAAAIKALLTDRILTERMGAKSRKRAIEEFSWDKIAQQITDDYLTL